LFLTFAAALSLLASELPRVLAWPVVALVVIGGLRQRACEAGRPCRDVVVDADAPRILLDGDTLDDPRVRWRGPIASLDWRATDGRRKRLLWWPDTLPPAKRRELRLAASGFANPPRSGTMAP
jgi:toxin CptA